MNDPQNLHTVEQWKIEDKNSLEILYPEYPHLFELRALQTGTPPDIGLSSEKREGVVGSYQKPVAQIGTGAGCIVVSLLIKIQIRSRPDNVPASAHRVPVFFRCSARPRCFSSQ